MLLLPGTNSYASELSNILEIWNDDVGWFNISAYNCGRMGYRVEFLPTNHGFDEFSELSTISMPKTSTPDYPKDPEFSKRFGRRMPMVELRIPGRFQVWREMNAAGKAIQFTA